MSEVNEILSELIIEFDKPIIVGNDTFDSITLREFTISQFALAQSKAGNGVDSEVKSTSFLMSTVSGAPIGVINAMPIRKFLQGQKYLLSFLA